MTIPKLNTTSENSHGFTTIELVILVIIIFILSSILIATFSGIRQRERNDTRISDIRTIQTNLESFYANNGFYPSLSEMNSQQWTNDELKQVPNSDLIDPSSKTGMQNFTKTAQRRSFVYNVTSASGSSCDNKTVPCAQYILSVTLEGNAGTYSVKSLN
ncbi:MAG TPA: hypothetical protein VMR76_03340 [Candidatus Saccharimonadia bacterium]|nr:hypothetical protein [Candidatus Saccharimonadia bacterium]